MFLSPLLFRHSATYQLLRVMGECEDDPSYVARIQESFSEGSGSQIRIWIWIWIGSGSDRIWISDSEESIAEYKYRVAVRDRRLRKNKRAPLIDRKTI